ncbi:MAG TPA: metal-dependent transcriptional regulator [Longimicrobiales bacterium]|nr:metal-dependent transcriptional regulator [Longimicrobiales bacterium]
MTSPAVEDYLKAIFHLSGEGGAAGTSAVAERLGVTAGSVTGMLKRLADQGFIEHVPYYGARLTPSGMERAVATIRRHRIIELFLVEVLGYAWDEVHEEAEALEHSASARLVESMSEVLGAPESDPHGAPIPAADGAFNERHYPSLAEIDTGTRAVLRRVSDEDAEALRYLAAMGMLPGTEIEVLERAPFEGPLRVRIGGKGGAEQVLGRRFAATLQVEPLTS